MPKQNTIGPDKNKFQLKLAESKQNQLDRYNGLKSVCFILRRLWLENVNRFTTEL